MMKLRLVRHNVHYTLNRIIILFVWFTAILHYAIDLHESVVIFFVLVMSFYAFILRDVVQPHTVFGTFIFEESSVSVLYKDGKINDFQYSKVTFVYGGYWGKWAYCLYSFTDFKAARDGVSNFLIFDDDPLKKMQIMLHNKREYRALLAYLEKLRDNGKDVVVTNFIWHQVKTFFKQFKQFINETI